MFFDIGGFELIALVILAILVFGPEKLPKVIQDTTRFIRKVREFSDSARNDIRQELGPEFKDFEFEDLNPKNFARKHLLGDDELGLKEIRSSFDLRHELNEVTDAVNGRELPAGSAGAGANGSTGAGANSAPSGAAATGTADPPRTSGATGGAERPPFDADAT